MDGRADGDDFIRVHALMRGLVHQRARGLDDAGHAGHAAHEHELVNLVGAEAGVVHAILHRLDGALEELVAELLHLGAGELGGDVLRAAGVGGHEGQVDVIDLRAGQGDLRLLSLFLDALERVGLLAEVDARVLLELVEDPVHHAVVPVVTAEVGVAIRGLDLKDTVADFQDTDVEGAAAEVIHRDLLVLLPVEAVGERGGGGLVYDAEDFQTGDLARVLGGLPLGVVEVCRDRDDRLGDGFAQARFGVGLELGEDHRGDFRRAELLGLAVHFDFHGGVAVGGADHLVGHALDLLLHLGKLAAHEPLHGVNRVARICHCLPLGRLAHDAFAGLGEGDDRRSGAFALGVLKHQRFAPFHDCHAGVRGAQINAQDFCHRICLLKLHAHEHHQCQRGV